MVKLDPQLDPDRTEIRPGAAGVRSVGAEEKGARESALGEGWEDY